MNPDPDRKPGFYWVRFEGEAIVAEWSTGLCSWQVPGSDVFYYDAEVCELLSGKLELQNENHPHPCSR